MSALTRHDASWDQLIQLEALLLDQDRHGDWLDLFVDDLVYWLPVDPAARRPEDGLNIIYDDRRRLTDRIQRLSSGHAHTEEPPRWVARVVGPGLVLEQHDREMLVRSGFVAFDSRNGETTTHGGHYLHRLLSAGDGWRIAEKKIELASSRTPMSALTCLL